MNVEEKMKSQYCEAKRIINEARREGQLVIFVGAGTSIGSGMPSWRKAVSKIASGLGIREVDISSADYLKIPQYYYNARGKKEYTQLMQEVFQYGKNLPKQNVHDLIIRFNTQTIITTNYDHLLEKAAEDNSELIHVISKDADLPYRKSGRELLKMHGDFENDNFVLKEDDYLTYSQSFRLIENYIKSIIGTKIVLFVGYSFNDPDIKHIFTWAKDILKGDFQPAYLIETGNEYDANVDAYYKNFGINVLYSSVQLENAYDPKSQTENLENMLKWLLEENKQKSNLEKLYNSFCVFEGLDYTYFKFVEDTLKDVDLDIVEGYITTTYFPQESYTNRYEPAAYILKSIAYERFIQNPDSVYIYDEAKKKTPYVLNDDQKPDLDTKDLVDSILTVLNKSILKGGIIYLPIDSENSLFDEKTDFVQYKEVYFDFDKVIIRESFRACRNFDEDRLRIISEQNSKRLNDSTPDLYMEQASIHSYLGDYIASYNFLRNASRIYYRTNNLAKYYISETDRYFVGGKVNSVSITQNADIKDIERIKAEIESLKLDIIYKSLPDMGEGKRLLKDISDFKLPLLLFHEAYVISEKIKEEGKTEYILYSGNPAFFQMKTEIVDYHLFEKLNNIMLDGYPQNSQIYRLYFRSVLDSALTPDVRRELQGGEKINNIHMESLSDFDIYLALRYETINDLRKILKNISLLPIDKGGYDYLAEVVLCSKRPERTWNYYPIRPFWKIVLLLGYAEPDRELFDRVLEKICEYAKGLDYREYGSEIIRFIDRSEDKGLVDRTNAKYIHNMLTGLVEYLVDGNQSDSRVLTQLAKLLACICGTHDRIFDNVSLIGKLLDNDASERLCVELYSYLGEKSQANIKEKFKNIKIDDNSADYELYGMLVGKSIIPPNKEIEDSILKYCLSGKDKGNKADDNKITVFLGNNNEDCTSDQLMVIMCDLFLKNKILDLKAFKAAAKTTDFKPVKWLSDIDNFDYTSFEAGMLDYCTPSLIKDVSLNITARKGIRLRLIKDYKEGKWDRKKEDIYFKYFADEIIELDAENKEEGQ